MKFVLKLAFVCIFLFAFATISFADFGSIFDNINATFNQYRDGFVSQGRSAAEPLFGFMFNNDRNTCGELGIGTASSDWLAPSVAAAILMLIITAMIYMFGQVLQSQNIINNAKESFYEVVLTALRVFFIVATLVTTNFWYTTTTVDISDPVYAAVDPTTGARTIIDASMAYSRLIIFEMSRSYSMLLVYNTVIHTVFSATMWFGVTWRAMYSFNLGPVLKPLIDIIGFAMQFLSVGLGEWILHLITLCLIKKWSWGLLIPAGFLLRAVPPTRQAGDALLSLLFSFIIMYPAMFLVNYEIYKLTKGSLANTDTAMSEFINSTGIAGVATTIFGMAFLLAGVLFPFFIGAGLTVAFELIRSAVYYIVIISLLLPFINIFVTLTTAKETARFFNVDVNFMAFVKLI